MGPTSNARLAHSSKRKLQVVAIAAALSQQVALIQGPPGTGKTFLGVQLVRVLLATRRRLADRDPHEDVGFSDDEGFGDEAPEVTVAAPILCVCFTNHALDQFLEGLLYLRTKRAHVV